MLSKQEVIKSNYALAQNAESLREQLRTFVDRFEKHTKLTDLFSEFELEQPKCELFPLHLVCPSIISMSLYHVSSTAMRKTLPIVPIPINSHHYLAKLIL